jgi:gliding motility-associated-like protein
VSVGNGFCTYIDTVEILIPIPEIILAATGSCAGDTITVNANNISPYPITSYDFGPDSLIISENGSSFATIATDYDNWIWVIATSAAGCTDDDSTFINVQGPPSGLIQATADQYIIGTGSSTVLHASPSGYTYSWTPSSSLDNPNSQNPTATPTETTTYIVSISNNGCMRTDTVVITIVDALCEEPYIFVPNAFTPNGDGENDKLYVRGLYIETLLFRVYNRWGEKVWETTDQTSGWDGTFQGRDCDPAVFDYYYQVTCPGGAEYFKKGNITLIR